VKAGLPARCCLALCCLAAFGAKPAGLSDSERSALSGISADSLRTSVSFLSSPALGGRATPSHGLDEAAEFIATQFRRAGLEAVGLENTYFQQAPMTRVTPSADGFRLTFRHAGEDMAVTADEVRIRATQAIDLSNRQVERLPEEGDLPDVEGKVVTGSALHYGAENTLRNLKSRKPTLILLLGRGQAAETGPAWLAWRDEPQVPVVRIVNEGLEAALADEGGTEISLHVAEPKREDFVARNVAGILRGSDPALRDQYVLLSAHYDHLGAMPGANDNASGTATVIEIARALAALPVHPKRSILFLALYGEEEDLLGAYYYTWHPLVPLADTLADVNLEQLGRTDEQDGRQTGAFAFTAPDYSDLPAIVSRGAKAEGVKVYEKRNAAAYFDRSDNYAFALAGIVAHTIVVAFEYPDYHAMGDEWQKLDYANMAKVDKGIGAGLLFLANGPERPHWSETTDTAPYREAVK
jgi:hypothetical protein